MTKKEENIESCKCGGNCCCGKIWLILLTLIGAVAAIVACIYSCKAFNTARDAYNVNVLSAGWIENLEKMNDLYRSEAYVKYATEQTDGYVNSFLSQFGSSEWENDANNTDVANTENNSSLDSLKNIAVELGTDETALQTCIDESRYTGAVNEMMNQGSQLFGVTGTPGNVIIDRENGNYILVAGAYPVEDFVNAINEYKNGAENYVAWGDEVKNVVEEMLAHAPVRGDENARFTIVEYTELLCPFCQRHSQAGTINAVIEQFSGEVNSISRHFIIHGDEALQLASAMECVAELNPSVYYETFEKAFEGL